MAASDGRYYVKEIEQGKYMVIGPDGAEPGVYTNIDDAEEAAEKENEKERHRPR